MKCDQCDKPGWYHFKGGKALCIDCYSRIEEISFRREQLEFQQALLDAAHLNRTEQDMAGMVGMVLPPNDLIPVAAIAAAVAARSKAMTTNISISGSTVGVLNAGDLAKIDAVVTITKGSDAEELGLAIQALTQAVVDAKDVDAQVKREIGEHLAALTEQIGGKKRSKPVIGSLLKGIEERAKGASAIWTLFEKVQTLANGLF